jgi:L-asparaginase II
MRAHPDVVGGSGRDVSLLMTAVPGLLVKDGAEGTAAAVLADGSAVVVKVADGAGRARTPVLVAGLRALGVDAPVLHDLATVSVRGGGRIVGAVRATLPGMKGTLSSDSGG